MPTKLTELQTPVRVTVSIFQYKSKRILHLEITSTGRRVLKQFIECNQILEFRSNFQKSQCCAIYQQTILWKNSLLYKLTTRPEII